MLSFWSEGGTHAQETARNQCKAAKHSEYQEAARAEAVERLQAYIREQAERGKEQRTDPGRMRAQGPFHYCSEIR
ncbi:MAG: hypothetical protein RLZZ360_330 [Candidatus Parcubacteria bacterium]|jgi:hypothetical protein